MGLPIGWEIWWQGSSDNSTTLPSFQIFPVPPLYPLPLWGWVGAGPHSFPCIGARPYPSPHRASPEPTHTPSPFPLLPTRLGQGQAMPSFPLARSSQSWAMLPFSLQSWAVARPLYLSPQDHSHSLSPMRPDGALPHPGCKIGTMIWI